MLYSFIKMMSDVDELEDLDSLYRSLNLMKDRLTQSQKKLIGWLEIYRYSEGM